MLASPLRAIYPTSDGHKGLDYLRASIKRSTSAADGEAEVPPGVEAPIAPHPFANTNASGSACPFSRMAYSRPALKQSPAPVVSTDSIVNAGASHTWLPERAIAPSLPRFTTIVLANRLNSS